MTWRKSALLKQRPEIAEFLDFILADDVDAVADLLARFPMLVREPLIFSSTRERASDYFIDEVMHYIYSGDTLLHIAAMAHCAEAVMLLHEHGADIAARNRRGAQPLHYACDGGPCSEPGKPDRQHATVASLIKLGADLNALDKSGVAPIHRAVRHRCTPALKALIEGGANVNLRNKSGSSPFKLATLTTGASGSGTTEAKREQEKILRLLTAAGANL